MGFQQDIFEVRANQGQRNGSLTVYPGSPIQTGVGLVTKSYGMDVNKLSYPVVTGLSPVTGLGLIGGSAISGAYGRKPSGRFDDITYY